MAGSRVNTLVKQIDPAWEHGELQAVTLTLEKTMTRAEVTAAFHLRDDNHLPGNVMSVDVQQCSAKNTCLILQGFDHQGTGD